MGGSQPVRAERPKYNRNSVSTPVSTVRARRVWRMEASSWATAGASDRRLYSPISSSGASAPEFFLRSGSYSPVPSPSSGISMSIARVSRRLRAAPRSNVSALAMARAKKEADIGAGVSCGFTWGTSRSSVLPKVRPLAPGAPCSGASARPGTGAPGMHCSGRMASNSPV